MHPIALIAAIPDGSYGFTDYLDDDGYGHEAGDAVLNRVARFLMRTTRAEESTVRMGGDEFLLLLDGVDASATENTSERLVFLAQLGQVCQVSRVDHQLVGVGAAVMAHGHCLAAPNELCAGRGALYCGKQSNRGSD